MKERLQFVAFRPKFSRSAAKIAHRVFIVNALADGDPVTDPEPESDSETVCEFN